MELRLLHRLSDKLISLGYLATKGIDR